MHAWRSSRPVAFILAVLFLASPLAMSGAAEEAVTEPAAEKRMRSRGQTKTMEVYDPGFQMAPRKVRDKAVERAVDARSWSDSFQPPEDAMGDMLPQVSPVRVTRDTERQSRGWLDSLKADEEDAEVAGDEFESLKRELDRMWGLEEADQDSIDEWSSLLDPYERMLESYREAMDAEDQEDEEQADDGLYGEEEADYSLGREDRNDGYEPVLPGSFDRRPGSSSNVTDLQDVDDEDLLQLKAEQIARDEMNQAVMEEEDADEWVAANWRQLLHGDREPSRAEDGDAGNTMSGGRLPFRTGGNISDESDSGTMNLTGALRTSSDRDHDFAGLTSIRKSLLGSGSEEAVDRFSPTAMEPTREYQSDVGSLSTFGFGEFGGESRTGGDLSGYNPGQLERREGFGESARGVGLDQPALGSGWQEPGLDSGSQRSRESSLVGDQNLRQRLDTQAGYDRFNREDTFGTRDRFGRSTEWGGFGK